MASPACLPVRSGALRWTVPPLCLLGSRRYYRLCTLRFTTALHWLRCVFGLAVSGLLGCAPADRAPTFAGFVAWGSMSLDPADLVARFTAQLPREPRTGGFRYSVFISCDQCTLIRFCGSRSGFGAGSLRTTHAHTCTHTTLRWMVYYRCSHGFWFYAAVPRLVAFFVVYFAVSWFLLLG